MLLPQEIIKRKRDGGSLTPQEITFFVKSATDWSIPESQFGALLMAVALKDLSTEELVAFTKAVVASGTTIGWSQEGLDAPRVDIQAFAGIGDKTAMILAPVLAACGAYVPMISSYGLSSLGGMLDKFECIPGCQVMPTQDLFKRTLKEVGCALSGKNAELAPADKRIYNVRKDLGLIDTPSLMTVSILSRKLAASLTSLVIDLKIGSGGRIKNIDAARTLGSSIVAVGKACGLKTHTAITDMNQIMGLTLGGALEVQEVIDFLTGQYRDKRLFKLVTALGTELLLMEKLASTPEDAVYRVKNSLEKGQAAERFGRLIKMLGGPSDLLSRPQTHLPQAPVVRPVYAEASGYVREMRMQDISALMQTLGGRRLSPVQSINHSVGFSDFCSLGDRIEGDLRPLATIHAPDEGTFETCARALKNAITILPEPVNSEPPLIYEIIK